MTMCEARGCLREEETTWPVDRVPRCWLHRPRHLNSLEHTIDLQKRLIEARQFTKPKTKTKAKGKPRKTKVRR